MSSSINSADVSRDTIDSDDISDYESNNTISEINKSLILTGPSSSLKIAFLASSFTKRLKSKLGKKSIISTSVFNLCQTLSNPNSYITLPLLSSLLYGTIVIFHQQVKYLLADLNVFSNSLNSEYLMRDKTSRSVKLQDQFLLPDAPNTMFLPDLLGPLPDIDDYMLVTPPPTVSSFSNTNCREAIDLFSTPAPPDDHISFDRNPLAAAEDYDDDYGDNPGFYFNNSGEIVPTSDDTLPSPRPTPSPAKRRSENDNNEPSPHPKRRRIHLSRFDPENQLSNDAIDNNEENYIYNMAAAKLRKLLAKRPRREINFAKVCLDVIGEPFSKMLYRDQELINQSIVSPTTPSPHPLPFDNDGQGDPIQFENIPNDRNSRASSIEVGRAAYSRLSSRVSSGILFLNRPASSIGVPQRPEGSDSFNISDFFFDDYNEDTFHPPVEHEEEHENSIFSIDSDALSLGELLKQSIKPSESPTFTQLFTNSTRKQAAISYLQILWLATHNQLAISQAEPGDIYIKLK